MKTLGLLCIGAALYVGGHFGVNWVTTPAPEPSPPSAEAQKLIDSMLSGKGWKIGRSNGSNDCVYHEKADIAVYRNGTMATGNGQYITTFSSDDIYWIKANYNSARKACVIAGLDKL